MADPEVGKLWVPESAAVVLDDLLTDVRLAMYAQGVTLPVTPGTDTHIWCTAFANAAMMLYSQLPGVATAANPLYCDEKDLEDWRVTLSLPVVGAAPSTGAIRLKVTGTGTVPDGTQLVLPNGKRIAVSGTWTGVTDGSEVDVVAYDMGADTNAGRGTVVRFRSAPLNIDTEATVSYERPLTGGTDAETTERKRTRVLNRLAFAASQSGNWGGLRALALDSLASVVDCFVYPALGGPASTKIVPVRGFDRTFYDFTRTFSTAAMNLIRSYIQAKAPDANQYVVQAAADQALNVALKVTIPESGLAGGNGDGWVDPVVWPQLSGGDTYTPIYSVSASNPQITLTANTTTAPVDGQTHIMWWSPHTMKFYQRTVLSHSGAAGAWVLNLDSQFVDDDGNTATAADFVSPAAERAEQYASAWLDVVESLGCGENITSSIIAPRDNRRPFISDGKPRAGMTTAELAVFKEKNPEIVDLEYSYRSSTSPTVPASIDTAPNIFVPQHFGIYQQ